MEVTKTVSIVLVVLLMFSTAIFVLTRSANIERDLANVSGTISEFRAFIGKLNTELDNGDIFNKTEAVLNDLTTMYDNFKDVNGTLLIQYASKMMKDLDKIASAIPQRN